MESRVLLCEISGLRDCRCRPRRFFEPGPSEVFPLSEPDPIVVSLSDAVGPKAVEAETDLVAPDALPEEFWPITTRLPVFGERFCGVDDPAAPPSLTPPPNTPTLPPSYPCTLCGFGVIAADGEVLTPLLETCRGPFDDEPEAIVGGDAVLAGTGDPRPGLLSGLVGFGVGVTGFRTTSGLLGLSRTSLLDVGTLTQSANVKASDVSPTSSDSSILVSLSVSASAPDAQDDTAETLRCPAVSDTFEAVGSARLRFEYDPAFDEDPLKSDVVDGLASVFDESSALFVALPFERATRRFGSASVQFLRWWRFIGK